MRWLWGWSFVGAAGVGDGDAGARSSETRLIACRAWGEASV